MHILLIMNENYTLDVMAACDYTETIWSDNRLAQDLCINIFSARLSKYPLSFLKGAYLYAGKNSRNVMDPRLYL